MFQVRATDLDLGKNAEMTYAFSSLTDPEIARMFSIDQKTGWVTLEWNVDFENQKQVILGFP